MDPLSLERLHRRRAAPSRKSRLFFVFSGRRGRPLSVGLISKATKKKINLLPAWHGQLPSGVTRRGALHSPHRPQHPRVSSLHRHRGPRGLPVRRPCTGSCQMLKPSAQDARLTDPISLLELRGRGELRRQSRKGRRGLGQGVTRSTHIALPAWIGRCVAFNIY